MYSNAVIGRADFNMEKEGYVKHPRQPWMTVCTENMSEWARLVSETPVTKPLTNDSSIYKTAKCSDFTVIAGGRLFPVHRVL